MSWLRRLPQAPVTAVLILANLLVYATMAATSRHVLSFDADTLVKAGATCIRPGLEPTVWRWLTAAFIHVHIAHILLNLWVLAQIGVLSESAIGRGLFAATYVVTGVSGNVLSTVLATARGHEVLSAGASGAIMGLIGAATAFAWRTGQRPIARALAWNILFVLAVGVSLSARGVVAVDNAAHVGGLLLGAVIGLCRARFPRPLPRWLNVLLLSLCAALTLTAFAVVHARGAGGSL
jgi:rhomboid protease GluP